MIRHLLLTRTVSAIATLIAVSLIVFIMVEMLPGDVASIVLGRFASEAAKAELRTQLNLDAPSIVRYLSWLGGLVTGDLGNALSSKRPVLEIITPRLLNTLALAGAALLIHFPLMLVVAILQAYKRYRPIDGILSTLTMIAASMPEFLLALLLLVLFVVLFPVLPAVSFVDAETSFSGWVQALVMPATTLAIVMSVYGIRMLRSSLIDILEAEFIQVAELRGLPPMRVLFFHALPNALAPVLNVTAFNLTYLIGGVVLVEKVFGFPGFGSLMIDAVSFRDVPLVEATVMVAATIYVVANLLSDVLSIILNPKLRRTL